MTNEEDTVPTTSGGTEPATDARIAATARRLANLKPPWSKGETGNPRGINGRGKANEIAAFLDRPESVESSRTRFEALIDSLFLAARRGDTQAAKTLIEYKLGKPRISPNALDLAEHFRRVDSDRFAFALQLLGDRVRAMSDREKSDFFNSLVVAQHGFLVAAEQFTNGEQPGETQETENDAASAEHGKQPENGPADQRTDDEEPGGKP
jgi:hypothetical protein